MSHKKHADSNFIFESVATYKVLSLKINKYLVPISSTRGTAVGRIFNQKFHVECRNFL